MRSSRKPHQLKSLLIAMAAVMVVFTACGEPEPEPEQTTTAATAPATTAAQPEHTFGGRLAEVVERGALRVGVAFYAPTSIETPEGDITGVDIDVTGQLADRLGVDIEYIPVGWDVIAAGVQADRYDMTVTLVVSDERDEVLDFSDPLYSVDQLFLVRADSPYQTLDDLNDPSVTAIVSVGSYGETVVDTYIPNATKRTVAGITNVQALAEVLTGRADVEVIETPFTTRRVKARYGDDVRFIPDVTEPLQSDFVAYGLPEGDTEFVEYVNAFLADLRAANAIEPLFDKYVEELLEPIIIEE